MVFGGGNRFHYLARSDKWAIDMKKAITEEQFRAAVRGLDVGKQTMEIAHGVLVQGRAQTEYAAQFGLSKGAVSQAVARVWEAHQALNLPRGFREVRAILPEHQAFIVNRWADEARRKMEAQQ